MNEDISLANAFSNSLRSAVLPKLNVIGEYSTETVFYIDSKQLRHYLKVLNTDSHTDSGRKQIFLVLIDEDEDENFYAAKHIPIFLFSTAYELPIFIDKYYTAKSLADMVIVVQSNFSSWESRITCM